MDPKNAKLPPLSFEVPVIRMPQPDGSLLVKPGKPQLCRDEVTTAEFSKATGICQRHVATLCDQGVLQHRRLTPVRRSKILIPRSELTRFRNLEGEI